MPSSSPKSRLVAALLAGVLGAPRIHRVYVGKGGSGIAMMLMTLTFFLAFISGIWALVDFIMILAGSFRDSENRVISEWTQ